MLLIGRLISKNKMSLSWNNSGCITAKVMCNSSRTYRSPRYLCCQMGTFAPRYECVLWSFQGCSKSDSNILGNHVICRDAWGSARNSWSWGTGQTLDATLMPFPKSIKKADWLEVGWWFFLAHIAFQPHKHLPLWLRRGHSNVDLHMFPDVFSGSYIRL